MGRGQQLDGVVAGVQPIYQDTLGNTAVSRAILQLPRRPRRGPDRLHVRGQRIVLVLVLLLFVGKVILLRRGGLALSAVGAGVHLSAGVAAARETAPEAYLARHSLLLRRSATNVVAREDGRGDLGFALFLLLELQPRHLFGELGGVVVHAFEQLFRGLELDGEGADAVFGGPHVRGVHEGGLEDRAGHLPNGAGVYAGVARKGAHHGICVRGFGAVDAIAGGGPYLFVVR
mmetsp:Transcript_10297/g.22872  ORF Transcript_10297/g.22872 Transcript_10297/m.22872 type:complete len:231 (-) Transcript_10297:264-956(-)